MSDCEQECAFPSGRSRQPLGNGGVDAPACEPSKWGPHDAPYAQPVTPGTDRHVRGYVGTHDVTGGVNFAVPVTRLVGAKWED